MINSKFELGSMLKKLRNDAGITTRRLAYDIGYSHGYISSVENGSKLSPSEDFIQKYLLRVCKKSVLLTNYYIDLINELSEGRYQFNLFPTSDLSEEAIEIHKINENFSNVHIFSDYSHGETKTVLFEEPINDIHFHLNEMDNQKYFRGIQLGADEMEDIDKMINDYLITIYKTQISQSLFLQSQGLISEDDLKIHIMKYDNVLKKLGVDIDKDSERRKLLDLANDHFSNEGD